MGREEGEGENRVAYGKMQRCLYVYLGDSIDLKSQQREEQRRLVE